MMRKVLSVFVFCSMLLMAGFVSADDSDVMEVRANIYASVTGIDVPSRVSFGDIAEGYVSERQDVNVSNVGTTDITVVPELDSNYTGNIFNYTSFRRILTDPLSRIGDFSVDVLKPKHVGEVRVQNVYMYLDLTDVAEEIAEDEVGHTANIIFWATPMID